MTTEVEELCEGLAIGNMNRPERTLQFYGLRQNWSWTMPYKKTRNPTKAIKDKFGHDLDPISLLGLHPTHPVRPMTAYDRRWEIVDLGRNKKKAALILEALMIEANEEHQLRTALDKDPMPGVQQWFNRWKHKLKGVRTEVSDAVMKGDFYHLFRHWGSKDMKGLVITQTVTEIVQEIEKCVGEETSGAQVLASMEREIAKIEAQLDIPSDPVNDGYVENMFVLARNVYERTGLIEARRELRNQIRDVSFVVNARNAIANRYSPPGIPADLRR